MVDVGHHSVCLPPDARGDPLGVYVFQKGQRTACEGLCYVSKLIVCFFFFGVRKGPLQTRRR